MRKTTQLFKDPARAYAVLYFTEQTMKEYLEIKDENIIYREENDEPKN